MVDNKDYMTHQDDMGTIHISEDVVASIATSAALEVEGVSGLLNANMADFMGGKKMTAKGVRVEKLQLMGSRDRIRNRAALRALDMIRRAAIRA